MKCPAAGTESITNAVRVRASSCTSDTPTSPSWCAPPTIRRTGHRICERCGASSSGSRALAMARYALRVRSEEHTSELQSHSDLVCRLLLEKKKRYIDED